MKRITDWYSNKVKGTIPKGCQLCSLGSKLVLFITGTCDSNCFYCPLTKEKRNDVIFADEKQIHSIAEAFEESKMISALGAGITGGDPSSNLSRSIEYMSKLKAKFGEEYHCHLYTSYSLSQTDLEALHSAGLDEIRFHPPRLQLTEEMKTSLKTAKTFSWDVGFEIPVIPDKEKLIQTVIDFAETIKLDFVNLNELEITEENLTKMNKLGYYTKTDISAAVKGSDEQAVKILKNNISKTITLHYCSSSYKDSIQLRNRLKRRAENYALPSDEITEDGLLVRARILLRDSKGLTEVAMMFESFGVPKELIEIDEENSMVYTNWKLAQKYRDDIVAKYRDNLLAIQVIHQYPHEDGIITYLDPIFESD